MITKPTLEEIQSIDISHLYPLAKDNDDNRRLLRGDAGVEHYKLLVWIARQFNDAKIIEVGTLGGLGTIALSENKSNQVVSFDIRSYKWGNETPENAEKKIVYDGWFDEIMDAPVIFYDAAHEGEDERLFLKELLARKWRGVIFWDDIHLNKEMVEFWGHCLTLGESENLQVLFGAEFKCEDWSDLGHATGTGVMFLK